MGVYQAIPISKKGNSKERVSVTKLKLRELPCRSMLMDVIFRLDLKVAKNTDFLLTESRRVVKRRLSVRYILRGHYG